MEQLLNNNWTLSWEQPHKQIGDVSNPPDFDTMLINFPTDIHSELLKHQIIPNPYWRNNEIELDWIHQHNWIAERNIHIDNVDCVYTLTIDQLDCQAEIYLNEVLVCHCKNQFRRYDIELMSLKMGANTLKVRFLSNTQYAKEQFQQFPFPLPSLEQNCRLDHFNFLRKTACHAGWDWNIALAPLGIYGDICLRATGNTRLDDITIRQDHNFTEQTVRIDIELDYYVWQVSNESASVYINGVSSERSFPSYPGQNKALLSVTLHQPELWWPIGEGEQLRHEITIRLGSEKKRFLLGLRQIKLINQADSIGESFQLEVNGRLIFMRGANWIPADALPARNTQNTVQDLLQSACDANMNMLRVWGGGQYEANWFYELCDEMGLLIWQDFMFACNLYPAGDKAWLQSVKIEAQQQVKRLSRFACMALWCGDNELVGTLNWFEESRKDRDRYLAMYDRLNHCLEQVIDEIQPDVAFWPSSPSVGRLNFGDGWHEDRAGDMHFWDVWHSAKDFEHYRTVQPRFCSEFGFQSFPSMRTITSFTTEAERNISSEVMEAHQRNTGGNGRIVETLARYFRFPDTFEHMVYLSQVSQGLAMKTAIEFWRSCKPRCMGTLYWQLNDTWPVASWSSLEYGGGWKLTHYLAKRFFAPVLVTAQPDYDNKQVRLLVINDLPIEIELTIQWQIARLTGETHTLGTKTAFFSRDRVTELARIDLGNLDDAILLFDWHDNNHRHQGSNEYLSKRPKEYGFITPDINVKRKPLNDGHYEVEISSTQLALYTMYDLGGDTIYDDNGFTLLPNQPKVIRSRRLRQSHLPEQAPEIWTLFGKQDCKS
ncbi:glycoside hydrolase family 2 protein [Marinomonas agarivorans]|nr:glycoside hydrolase family 2 protein [Marinomonas agarivorans]